MAYTFEAKFTEESKRVLADQQDAGVRMLADISQTLQRGLIMIENHLKMEYLRGGDVNESRDGSLPLAVRSGGLLQSISHGMDNPLSGYIGSIGTVASKYAKVLLGGETVTITPTNAKHLWIPVADNRTAGGQTRMSPTEFFEVKKSKRSIFMSKAGNLVAGIKSAVAGVRRKGFKLMFVLKDKVRIKGTDALAKSVEDKRLDLNRMFTATLVKSLGGDN